MAILTIHQISIRFGGPDLLDQVSLNIEAGDRACVTGGNGEGKSTLLKVIAGIIEPDRGEIIRQPGLRVAYLSQDVPADRPGTVLEVAEEGLDPAEEGNLRAKPFLSQLGVDPDVPFNTLSGGLRRRALLAKALASDPQLLLLDEPTNHLDIASIEWLENFLQKSRFACLFVTHDRAFLKHVAKKVLDLDRGQLAGWDCDYATFLKRKQDLLSDEAVYWERKSKKLSQEEAWLRRGVKARTTRNEGRVAALMKLREEFKQRRARTGVSRLRLGNAEASGAQVIKIKDVSFAYPGGKPLIEHFSAHVLRGERIGIIGPNGAGKTTLLNLLCGKLKPTSGEIQMGERVRLAFFDQLRAKLNLNQTVVENLAEGHDEVVVNGTRKHVFSYLNDFLFTSDRARTPVSALSGGERARLLLAKLFLQPGNLLVMDEPTNDLDVETLELLEEQVQGYRGTLLLVSHDRTFLDDVVTSSFVLEGNGKIGLYPGGYEDWLRQRPKPEPKVERATNKVSAPARSHREDHFSYNEKRERERLPGKIDALEKEVAALQATLCDTSLYQTDPSAIQKANARLPEAERELETAFSRWAELEERAEKMNHSE